ncbi:hypothetical protein L7F22_018557 [Adiantum nelumboides]|nr:hypothetical protein [Adiantum nelumboides]
MADNNEEGRINVDSFDFANEGASEETPMLVNYLITRLQQAMANPALQGEVQQQLQAYGFVPPHQEERILEKPLGETSKRGISKGSHKSVTGLGRQLLSTTYTECKQSKSFWSVLAKKAKFVLLDDDSSTYQQSDGGQSNNLQAQFTQARPPTESKQPHGETPLLQRRLVALTSSLSSLGGSIGNAIEESLNKMEAKATDLMSSKKGTDSPRAPNLQDAFHVSGSFVRREFFPKSLRQGQPFVEPSKCHDSDQKLQTSPPKQADSALKPSQHHPREDSVLRPLQQQHSGHSAADKETQLKASRDNLSSHPRVVPEGILKLVAICRRTANRKFWSLAEIVDFHSRVLQYKILFSRNFQYNALLSLTL